MLTRTKLLSVLLIAVLLSMVWVSVPVSGSPLASGASSPSAHSLPRDVSAKPGFWLSASTGWVLKSCTAHWSCTPTMTARLLTRKWGCAMPTTRLRRMCWFPCRPGRMSSSILPPTRLSATASAPPTASTRAKPSSSWAGCPPQAKYFGLQSYLFTHQGTFDVTSDFYLYLASLNKPELMSKFFTYVPQDHQRIIQFASLSNSINNVVIEDQSGEAFDTKKLFIITPDRTMDAGDPPGASSNLSR